MAGCNEAKCLCPNKDCKNHGKCCECVNYHRDERQNLPICLRSLIPKKAEGEK